MSSMPPPPPLGYLREIGLFGGLDDSVLSDFVQRLPTLDLSAGDIVFREGDTGRELYIVVGGEMEILKHSRHKSESRVAMLGPGDWFGEMSILDIMPRSATVRVLAPSRLIKLSSTDLDGLYRRDLKSYSIIILNIGREISRRLRVADGILADMIASVAEAHVKQRA